MSERLIYARSAREEAERRLIIARRELALFNARRIVGSPGYDEMHRRLTVSVDRCYDHLAHCERELSRAHAVFDRVGD
jgi:hypothetical protein